jgi:hypothetical protein
MQVIFSTQHVVYDAEGNRIVKEEWPRMAPEVSLIESLGKLITEYITPAVIIEPPAETATDLMLEWILADLHHGMRAEPEETGQKYNIEISKNLVIDSAKDIFSRAQTVDTTHLIVLGDFFHSDFRSNKTEKSGHSLWTADTHENIAKCGVFAILTAIDICLQHSAKVVIDILPGNHDSQSAMWLELLVATRYINEPRVEVSKSQCKARFFSWGVSFFGYHHIDTGKPVDLAIETLHQAIALSEERPKFFYARTAHVHRSEKTVKTMEDSGKVIIERIPTIAVKDKFTSDGLYNSQRGTVATVFHKTKGQRYRLEVSPEVLNEE